LLLNPFYELVRFRRPIVNDEILERIKQLQKSIADNRDDIKEDFDYEIKAANLLLVAHAAGLIGCIALLKDYNENPHLQGIGILIRIFASGLVFGITGYSALLVFRGHVTSLMLIPKQGLNQKMMYLTYGALGLSVLLLMAGVSFIAYRLGTL
jgi:hypothetical protein